MPIYVFECLDCNNNKDIPLSVNDRDKVNVFCDVCNSNTPMKRISAVRGNVWNEIEPYFDENLTNDATETGGGYCPSYDKRDHCPDGVFIKSRKHKRELMKRWGYEFKY